MRSSIKLLASATVSLAVAGTCLAAPAFAVTAPSVGDVASAAAQAAEKGDAASAGTADTAVSLGTHVNFAGLAFDLPEGLEQQKSGDESVAMWTNEAGTIAVAVYDMRGVAVPEGTEWSDYFAEVAQASVASLDGATVEDLGRGEFEERLGAYTYGITASDDDGDYNIAQIYVPMEEGGFTFMQIGCTAGEISDAENDGLTALVSSIKLASEDGLDIDSLQTSACGLTFELPEGLSAYEGDENAWMDADGNIIIKAVGHVAQGASKLTGDEYAELFAALEPTGDSDKSTVELVSQGTVDGQGDVVSAYNSYKVVDPDETMYAVVIVTPIPSDDSISVVICWCSEAGSEKYGEAIMDMMETFSEE